MKIIGTQYSLKYKSLEIAISGCRGMNGAHCKGCHSPETWDFNLGTDWLQKISSIIQKISRNSEMIKWIWVYGGEPLDNNLTELEQLLIELQKTEKPILLFTRYTIDTVPLDILQHCDYIKCGAYDEESLGAHTEFGIQLSTTNQHIFMKRKLKEGEYEWVSY